MDPRQGGAHPALLLIGLTLQLAARHGFKQRQPVLTQAYQVPPTAG